MPVLGGLLPLALSAIPARSDSIARGGHIAADLTTQASGDFCG
jgi:hypothetical protein